MEKNGSRTRAVVGCQPVKIKKIVYHLERKRCPKCRKVITASPPGVLLVDRYNGYNKMPCSIQYCYAHLLRDVRDLEKDFPENAEVKSFVQALAPQLANAIGVRTLDITDKQFQRQAAKIKNQIIKITNHQARHLAIQKI